MTQHNPLRLSNLDSHQKGALYEILMEIIPAAHSVGREGSALKVVAKDAAKAFVAALAAADEASREP